MEIDMDMIEEWGKQCPDFNIGCPCCLAWSLYNSTGIVPSSETVFNIHNGEAGCRQVPVSEGEKK